MVRGRLAGHGDAVLGLGAHDPADRHTASLAVIHRPDGPLRPCASARTSSVMSGCVGQACPTPGNASSWTDVPAAQPDHRRVVPVRSGVAPHPSYAAQRAVAGSTGSRGSSPSRPSNGDTRSTRPCTRRSVTGGPPCTHRSGTVDEETTTTARHRAASTQPIVCASSPPLENPASTSACGSAHVRRNASSITASR